MTRSNCLLWAIPRWLMRGRQDQSPYLLFRWSRIPWGILHCLLGEMDPVTGQIAVRSFKPPIGHRKPGIALTFEGSVVEGDALIRWVELSEDVTWVHPASRQSKPSQSPVAPA